MLQSQLQEVSYINKVVIIFLRKDHSTHFTLPHLLNEIKFIERVCCRKACTHVHLERDRDH